MPRPFPAPLLPLDRAGALDRLAAALRFAPFDDDVFARAFDAVDLDDDFARPFGEDDFFAPDERLVVRDALVLLRALADLLRVLEPLGFARLLVPVDFEGVVRFAAEVVGFVSAICSSPRKLSPSHYPSGRRITRIWRRSG